mmetsp:Transcript_29032/g.52615  ORF Transcript_29032/g.52615 Transcript_29032/m.52615 type:complete len:903 (+) Transcript_29032:88-2796(+)
MPLMWAACLSLLAQAAANTENWHVVDIPAVICEKTENDTDAPEYAVAIEYTNDIVQDYPYIISFARASDKATEITFRVVDANGETVIDKTTVTLGEVSNDAGAGCECTGELVPEVVSSVYGTNYGSACYAHDNANCDLWWGEASVGGWCCSSWCYSTSNCKDAYESTLMPGKYYSYKACTQSTTTTCRWDAVAAQNDPCSCKPSYSLFDTAMKAKFPSNYGDFCSAWDSTNCGETYPDQYDTWCCTNWCYVDRACVSAVGSYNEGLEDTLFFSYNVCPDDPAKVGQCPWKPRVDLSNASAVEACACLDVQMPSNLLPTGAPADYGSTCSAHDKDSCDSWYPSSVKMDMWCCTSWCWVDESCPGSQEADTIWPGHYFSGTSCTEDATAIMECKYNSTACSCTGSPGTAVLGNAFPDDYGADQCKAWDSTGCKDKYGNSSDWIDNNDWCCDSWCYVSGDCPIASTSWVADGYFYSYDACSATNTPGTHEESTDTCSARRLNFLEVSEVSEDRGQERRLSARRRSGGSRSRYSSSSSSYSASRPSSPRRRAPAPPPPPVRRRNPSPPTPITELRRRTTSMNGQSPSTTRRRAPPGDTSPRRRSSYDGAYGYTNKPQMMNNYGNQMPYQTQYGYSGYHAYPSHSNNNMVWAAGGGLAAGYLAGSYFGGYGYHRYDSCGYRRRLVNGPSYGSCQRQPSYCVVPSDMPQYQQFDRAGDFIDCQVCKLRYTFCLDASQCQTSYGCGYQTQQAFNRDDLAETGFIPKDWKGPLSVMIESIVGEDFNPDPLEAGFCPPVTDAQKKVWADEGRVQTIRLDLFVVLTKQDKLRDAGACNRDTGKKCSADTDSCIVKFAQCNLEHICECPAGMCLNALGTECVDAGMVVSAAERTALSLLLVCLAAAVSFFDMY